MRFRPTRRTVRPTRRSVRPTRFYTKKKSDFFVFFLTAFFYMTLSRKLHVSSVKSSVIATCETNLLICSYQARKPIVFKLFCAQKIYIHCEYREKLRINHTFCRTKFAETSLPTRTSLPNTVLIGTLYNNAGALYVEEVNNLAEWGELPRLRSNFGSSIYCKSPLHIYC